MPKYYVYASETIFYMKEIEAESEDQARQMIETHEIDFDYGDVNHGLNFRIHEIEEEKRYA